MRTVLSALVVFAAAVGLIAAPTPKDKEKVKDEDSIQGTWQIEKFDNGGGPQPPIDITQIKFTFKKDGKMKMELPGGKDAELREGDYKLDSSAKPKTIDMIQMGHTALGIYELDGDTFKLCMNEGQNAARPEEFKPDGKRTVVVTFKRVKEEKKEDKKDEKKDK